jgi:hypothetical protein
MSLEESLAKCAIGTGLAGVACVGAAGTGGLGAAACALSVGAAAVECYGAGKEAWQTYEREHPEEAKEILEREREEREREEKEEAKEEHFFESTSNSDDAWNSVYQAGIDNLVDYSRGVELFARVGPVVFPVQRRLSSLTPSALRVGDPRDAVRQAKARDELVGICQAWVAWRESVKGVRFNSHEHSATLANLINEVTKFTALRHQIKSMEFASP